MNFHLSLVLLPLVPFLARAVLVNVTVDDSGSDPVTGQTISYSPVGGWKTGKQCNDCTAHPLESLLYQGTWHDSTFNSQPGSNDVPNQPLFADFKFNGTAVYVFCVLARTKTGASPSGYSDMTFYINGTIVGTFQREGPGQSGYDYNVTVFSATSLPPGFHSLSIQNGHVDGKKSLLLLDAISYTYDDGSSDSSMAPSKSGPPLGAILGGVAGGLAFLIAIIIALFCWRRRQNIIRQKELQITQPTAFDLTRTPHAGPQPSYVLNNGSPAEEFNPYFSPTVESHPTSPSAPSLSKAERYALLRQHHHLNTSTSATSFSHTLDPSFSLAGASSSIAAEPGSTSGRHSERDYRASEPPAYDYGGSEVGGSSFSSGAPLSPTTLGKRQ